MKVRIKILLTVLTTVFLLLGFAMPVNMVGNWYQQFLPNIGSAQITDITFTDSLNGYIVTSTSSGTSYILKTTNSGDNWNIKFTNNRSFVRVKFINSDTGFTNAFTTIFKTTNAGENWNPINLPGIFGDDMFVLSKDTIWLAMSESFTGGVWRTTNGGGSWENQLNIGSLNPLKIYMFNSRIGFIANNTGSPYIRKTTNSGINWDTIVNGRGFSDMFFVDSLTGWTAFDSVRKTTNGGLNWQTQVLPYGGHMGGFLNFSYIFKFSYLSKDTIWGVGGRIAFPNTQLRGLIYRTTNGGNTWGFQLPDTSINIGQYLFVNIVNKNIGWAYSGFSGVHTTTGGDTTLMRIRQISNVTPKNYKLYQNYPNPFNPVTTIRYELPKNSKVKLVVYDLLGREVKTLVNEIKSAGYYQIEFNMQNYASGVYFYRIEADDLNGEKFVNAKKMVLVK